MIPSPTGSPGGKRAPTRLGFALLLKFYAQAGRFPRGRAELDNDAVAFVACQVGVPASDLGFYEWAGSMSEYHGAQIRRHLGFRECTTEDADKLTAWLAGNVCQAERRPDRVREELLAQCRAGQAELALTPRVTARLGPDPTGRPALAGRRRTARRMSSSARRGHNAPEN